MSVTFQAIPCWRVIATRVPSADLFSGVADFGEWEATAEIENLWNENALGILGNLAQIPRDQRAYGPGSSYIMAPFVYRAPGRFGDGSYGVLYAGLDEPTALEEVAWHRARFMSESANPRETMDYQVLGLGFSGEAEDIRGLQAQLPEVYDTTSWAAGQRLGAQIRGRLDGIAYSSVRRRGGECLAGFQPRLFSGCRQLRIGQFFWDGVGLSGPGGMRVLYS